MDSGNLLWRMRNKICPFFCQIHWIILIFKSDQNLSIITALQPWVIVVKDIFPFAIFAMMNDSYKKVTFIEVFNKILIFCKNFQEVVSKVPYSWNNSMKLASLQPSVTVAKRKISFATMTHGCEGYFSLRNRDWRLQRWPISWDFPILFMKMNWLLKTCIYLWVWQKEPISFLLLQRRFLES